MVFMLMALIVWAVQASTDTAALPVPEARLSELVDDHPLSSGSADPDLAVTQPLENVESDAVSDDSIDLLSEVASESDGDISIIGIGAGAGGGDLASFGLNSGGLGEGPSFFGLGRNAHQARRICYVVDRSGSMVDELDYVKDEVKRSIGRLHRVQQYHIIFFSSGPPVEAPPRRFVHAIEEYRRKSAHFLDGVDAAGSTNPIPAMARAFQLDADLIYFLTDGEFSPELVERLRVWNKDQTVRVYTIAFLRRQGEEMLRRIARENGGEFTFVSEQDLP
jgi:hypothetical protein